MPAEVFFNYLNRLMVSNPPAAADAEAMTKFAAIGVKPGGTFDLHEFDTQSRRSLPISPRVSWLKR